MLGSNGKQCEVELNQALWVSTYTFNLICVKTLAQKVGEITFGKHAHKKTFDGTL